VLVCGFDVQLSDAALPAAVRLRILLGRIRHPLSGVSGPAPLQPPASPGIRKRPVDDVEQAFSPAPSHMQIISAQLVREAAERIKPLARRTPVMTSRSVDERAGLQVFLKCENLQRSGAFQDPRRVQS